MGDPASSSNKSGKSVEFSAVDSGGLSESGSAKRRSSSAKSGKRRSSLLKALSQSFRRSGGERGADVEALRGTQGPDFEAEGIINRGGPDGCNCFGGRNLQHHLLLIKGPFVFVFMHESDKAPKYAINLAHLKAKLQGGSASAYLVTLETTLGDVEYELSFNTESIAKDFVHVVKKQASVGEAEEVRKRLGHASLLSKRSSVSFAEKIAMKKVEDQPEKKEPVTADEMAKVMGGTAGLPM